MSLTNMIFLNLPVADVGASTAFYKALGAEQNMQFSDDSTSCIVLSEAIYVMLLSHDRFASFLPGGRAVADANAAVGSWHVISQDSRAAVDALVDAAGAAGGTSDLTPADDHGFMYGRNFTDPDGHIWNAFWMDPTHVQG